MNRLFTLTAIVFFALSSFAQSPEKMSYQAVIRNAAGELVKQQPVGMQVSILQGSADGILVFAETHEATSNENGLVSIEIGAGVLVNGSFAAIDWSAGPYFLKTETDPEGGFNYTISGTSQLLSVPYAMHAKTAESLSGELLENDPLFAGSVAAAITTADTSRWNATQDDESDPVFSEWDKSSGITINKSQISDLGVVVETETDPVFKESAAANISQYNIYKWNQKLDSESDPVYKKSVAAGISNADTARWNQNLATETDPVYSGSQAFNITADDIANLSNLSGVNTGDQDGSETKVTAGTNVTVTGSGTTASPYVVNATAATTLAIGDNYQGGIIFWLDTTGQHGLIAATQDQSTGIQWYNGTYTTTNAVRDGIGAGMYNTERIIANQSTGSYAAQLCANYQGGGYGDWYLPSKYELNLLYLQKTAVGGFASAFYWSSTEYGDRTAWVQNFGSDFQTINYKNYTLRVRAVRAF